MKRRPTADALDIDHFDSGITSVIFCGCRTSIATMRVFGELSVVVK